MGDMVGTRVVFSPEECALLVEGMSISEGKFLELLQHKVMDAVFQVCHQMVCMPKGVAVESFDVRSPDKPYYGDLMIEAVYRLPDDSRFRHAMHFVFSDRGRKLDGKLFTQSRRLIPNS